MGKITEDTVFPPPSYITTIFITIALYNVAELLIIIVATFRHFCGLYFWSFLAATIGIAVYLTGIILRTYYLSTDGLLIGTPLVFGWIPMVTGQAFVLYSCLRYVVENPKILRAVFVMIVANGAVGHLPIIAMVYGAVSSRSLAWVIALLNYEKVQVTIFFIQSNIISGLYIFHSYQKRRLISSELDMSTSHLLRTLIWLNMVFIVFEISILVFEWTGPNTLSAIYKAVAYSVKLKIEYKMFNKITDLLSSPPVAAETEVRGDEEDVETLQEKFPDQTVTLQTFNGKVQILNNNTLGSGRFSMYPAGEAVRSHLNDLISAPISRSNCAAIEHWADEVSDEEDISSFYTRSRRTMSEAGTGLSPSPRVVRKGSLS